MSWLLGDWFIGRHPLEGNDGFHTRFPLRKALILATFSAVRPESKQAQDDELC
jgi:hypothetical protein